MSTDPIVTTLAEHYVWFARSPDLELVRCECGEPLGAGPGSEEIDAAMRAHNAVKIREALGLGMHGDPVIGDSSTPWDALDPHPGCPDESNTYFCTRSRGHTGCHAASDGDVILETWTTSGEQE